MWNYKEDARLGRSEKLKNLKAATLANSEPKTSVYDRRSGCYDPHA